MNEAGREYTHRWFLTTTAEAFIHTCITELLQDCTQRSHMTQLCFGKCVGGIYWNGMRHAEQAHTPCYNTNTRQYENCARYCQTGVIERKGEGGERGKMGRQKKKELKYAVLRSGSVTGDRILVCQNEVVFLRTRWRGCCYYDWRAWPSVYDEVLSPMLSLEKVDLIRPQKKAAWRHSEAPQQ